VTSPKSGETEMDRLTWANRFGFLLE